MTIAAAAAAAIVIGGVTAASAQQTPPATSTPAPTPTPTATPFSSGTYGGAVTVMGFQTNNTNATGALNTPTGADQFSRVDMSNLLVNASYTVGYWKGSATVGGYNFPTVGTSLNQTFNNYSGQNGGLACANVSCFTLLPLWQLGYTSPDSHITAYAGQLGTLLGTEGAFTYQNVNIERGLGWALEPVFSRGFHAGYSNGPWSIAAEYNTGFFSGSLNTIEYSLAWAPSSNTSVTFVGMNPGVNTKGNATSFVANQSEYNLYYTHTAGKWQFSPYILFVSSPASAPLGYTQTASDFAISLPGSYAFSSLFSVGFRVEDASNGAAATSLSPNAFLLYGPGSGATTYTLTPTFKFGSNGILRMEWGHTTVRGGIPGAVFGPMGVATQQDRFGIELGATR